MLTIALELFAVACFAAFAFLVWWPLVLLVLGVAAVLIAWVQS